MWATKEINVSHIISVCLVVIARKRENILSRQKLLQVAFSRQGAIVQQQKSSADVKSAIIVRNMTLVFLLMTMTMSMATTGDEVNHLFGLAVDWSVCFASNLKSSRLDEAGIPMRSRCLLRMIIYVNEWWCIIGLYDDCDIARWIWASSKVPTNVNVCKNTIQYEGFENVYKCKFCQKQP